jgi:uncharacterized protein YbjQ (UPF0145 family)
MEKSMTTTTFELDGYEVARHLGVVRGIVVRSRSVFGTIGGILHNFFKSVLYDAVSTADAFVPKNFQVCRRNLRSSI